jgi:malonyl-CoA O-methyltransferase
MAYTLLGMAEDKPINKILEIGSGTGNYTLFLREKFINSEIKAVDISDRMIEVAAGKINGERVEFMLDDAECIDLNEEFDIVTSNACFQWFGNLENALLKYKNLLKDDGVILFSTFGPITFKELNESLKCVFKNVATDSGNFMGKADLESMLEKNFKEVEIKETIYTESFSSLKKFLGKIKHSGIRGDGQATKVFFTPQLMKKLEEVYLDKFGQIQATYQVFFCRGTK